MSVIAFPSNDARDDSLAHVTKPADVARLSLTEIRERRQFLRSADQLVSDCAQVVRESVRQRLLAEWLSARVHEQHIARPHTDVV